ncbi:MAG TPA: glucose-6-phosphate isomerase, partial [Chitinophagaceae bacterium]|nr:glucose-6-phosphate isomerase [Chitinophagaceae bacterium]
MLPKINPTATEAWKSLQTHFSEMKNVHLKELFKKDPERFSKFSIADRDIIFDYSKNIITEQTIELLIQL